MNLGLVGESGCGKSTVVKALMGLFPKAPHISGKAFLDDQNILGLSERELEDVRWTRIALITQSAMNSLDPVYCIGDQIVEFDPDASESVPKGCMGAGRRGVSAGRSAAGAPARVSASVLRRMRQRAVIAMALSLNAGLLLADEPTTALDPIMQDQIMARIRGIHEQMRRSMILVTHDIAVVAETCETTVVMYAGQVVESGPTADVLQRPFIPTRWACRTPSPNCRRVGRRSSPSSPFPAGCPTCCGLRRDAASRRAVRSPPTCAGRRRRP